MSPSSSHCCRACSAAAVNAYSPGSAPPGPTSSLTCAAPSRACAPRSPPRQTTRKHEPCSRSPTGSRTRWTPPTASTAAARASRDDATALQDTPSASHTRNWPRPAAWSTVASSLTLNPYHKAPAPRLRPPELIVLRILPPRSVNRA